MRCLVVHRTEVDVLQALEVGRVLAIQPSLPLIILSLHGGIGLQHSLQTIQRVVVLLERREVEAIDVHKDDLDPIDRRSTRIRVAGRWVVGQEAREYEGLWREAAYKVHTHHLGIRLEEEVLEDVDELEAVVLVGGGGHPVTADLTLGIAIVDLDVVGRGDFTLDVLVHCRAVRRGIEYGGRANICIHFAAAAEGHRESSKGPQGGFP